MVARSGSLGPARASARARARRTPCNVLDFHLNYQDGRVPNDNERQDSIIVSRVRHLDDDAEPREKLPLEYRTDNPAKTPSLNHNNTRQ